MLFGRKSVGVEPGLLFDIVGDMFDGRFGDSDTSGAYELAYVVAFELFKQGFRLVVMTGFLKYGVFGSDIKYARTVMAYDIFQITFNQEFVGRHFI